MTGAALRMTWRRFFVAGAVLYRHGIEKSETHWHEAVSSTLNFPFWKEASRNFFIFDVANLENGGSPAELLRFRMLHYNYDYDYNYNYNTFNYNNYYNYNYNYNNYNENNHYHYNYNYNKYNHNNNYTTLPLHCAASNHLSVHQWVRSAIHY